MNESFLFNSIHKYNCAKRIAQRDSVLFGVGVHVGLIERRDPRRPQLSVEERDRVLGYLRDFLAKEGLTKITIRNYHYGSK